MQQRARIDVVVMIVRQKDGRRFGDQRTPERRYRGFRKPRKQPRIEEQHVVALAIENRSMSEMHRIPILDSLEPMSLDGGATRTHQTLVLMQRFDQPGEDMLSVTT